MMSVTRTYDKEQCNMEREVCRTYSKACSDRLLLVRCVCVGGGVFTRHKRKRRTKDEDSHSCP